MTVTLTRNTAKVPLSPHLKALENEAIYIFRESASQFRKPVMMYSVGKDSSVLLHLAKKAFFPGSVPFPLLHINTGWKFAEMIAFRDRVVAQDNLQLISYTNPRGAAEDITPFSAKKAIYTDVMKTEALRTALAAGGFDAAFGGARRDEEVSRAKERIISIRSKDHRWDPRNQRPEFWSVYNTHLQPGQSARVFPLSNWTEQDIWAYIQAEQIPIVPLYFAAPRPYVERDGMKILATDPRLELLPGEQVRTAMLRFRTLGCFPLTGAIESGAQTLDEIISELRLLPNSERHGRAIDKDANASMEKKKREGYF